MVFIVRGCENWRHLRKNDNSIRR